MRVPKTIVLVFLVSFIPIQLNSQQTTAAVKRDQQAVLILTQVLQAAGGPSAVGSIQSFTGLGTITCRWSDGDVEGSAVVRGRGLNQFRLDATVPTGVLSWAVSNGSGQVKTIGGAVTPIPYHNAVNFGSLILPIAHVSAALNDPATNILYIGAVLVNGHEFQEVRVEPFATEGDPDNLLSKFNAKSFFIDSSTFQISRTLNVIHPNGDFTQDYPHEVDFGNYQQVNGVYVPFSIAEKVAGQDTWTLRLSAISFNSALTDADFQF